jgi:competence protein ComEC
MKRIGSAAALAAFTASGVAWAGPADKRLDVYWVDVEGGAATLVVTPAGESVLFDTGYPGPRDAKRIQQVATEKAGLKKIDHVVVTHFHVDHYGGLTDLVKEIPVGTVWDHDLATAAPEPGQAAGYPAYKEAKADKRVVVKPGDKLPLKQIKGAAPVTVQFLGALEKFATLKGGKANLAVCKEHAPRPVDATDNKNSVVTLVSFGPFRFFEGGDTTWNTEKELVCPTNRLGGVVDVYQANHHGLDQSNNPVLVKTLAPTVAVINNGPKKAGEPNSFATFKATPSIKSVYQLHRNLRSTPEQNTAPELTANVEDTPACKGNFVKLSVEPDGKTYALAIPATGHEAKFETRKK